MAPTTAVESALPHRSTAHYEGASAMTYAGLQLLRSEKGRLRALASRSQATARLILACAGPVPVTLIALAAFGVAELRTLAVWVLAPVVLTVLVQLALH